MDKKGVYSKRLVPTALIALCSLIGISAYTGHWIFGSVAGLLAVGWIAWNEYRNSAYGNSKRMQPHPVSDDLKGMSELDAAYLKAFHLHRHDWMNDIQLLIGYAKLQKTNQLLECVNYMKDKAMRESALFKLGVPKLSLFLHTLQSERQHVELELEIEPNLRLDLVSEQPEATAGLITYVVNAFREAASIETENQLILGIMTENGQRLVIYFECLGEYDKRSLEMKITSGIAQYAHSLHLDIDIRHEEGGSNITLCMPIKQKAS